MKAKAFIFTHAQKPATMFGLPMVLASIVLGCIAPVFGLLVVLEMEVLGFVTFLVLGAIGMAFLWRKQREDCHFQSLVTVALPFWRGKAERRFLCGRDDAAVISTTGALQ